MIACKACGNELAGNAAQCPKCGHRRTSCAVLALAVVFGIGGALFLLAMLGEILFG
jgi:hypothetical protein